MEMISNPEYDIELHDRERRTREELAACQAEYSRLDQYYKQQSLKQTELLTSKNQANNVELIRQQIRNNTQLMLKKRDKVAELDKQIAAINERLGRFKQHVPLLNEKLETGLEENDLDGLMDFLRQFQLEEKQSKPQVEQVEEAFKKQNLELEQVEQKLKIAKSAYEKQKSNNERQVTKLQDEIEALINQREQLNTEYK